MPEADSARRPDTSATSPASQDTTATEDFDDAEARDADTSGDVRDHEGPAPHDPVGSTASSLASADNADGPLNAAADTAARDDAAQVAPYADDSDPDGTDPHAAYADDRPGLTPRQARRVRIAVSAAVMTAVAVALVVRLTIAPSVLIVGFYGMALILSGTAIGLSRRGRTRVATAVLALGFAAVALAEWLLSTA